jgi:A/G-specific adenine glycosylase
MTNEPLERPISWAWLDEEGVWQIDQERRELFRHALITWFHQQKRELPWRIEREPYRVWLSEIMLQQTRVETVIPYFHRFLERFPTIFELAKAPTEEVLALWAGLGYYRRARMLHQAAQEIVEKHQGSFPSRLEEITALPGIGRYTAGAIGSLAFGLELPLVDGNVYRIFSRIFRLFDPIGSKELERKSWFLADALVKGEAPGDLNEALMELGATICMPRKALCLLCPVRGACEAHRAGDQALLPIPKKAKTVPVWRVHWAWIERGGEILVEKRADEGLFAQMWELPGRYDVDEAEEEEKSLRSYLLEKGLAVKKSDVQARHYTHLLTHRQLEISVSLFLLEEETPLDAASFRWIVPHSPPALPFSSVMQKILRDFPSSKK